MNNENFVKNIKLYIRDMSIEGILKQLKKPSGRSPKKINIKKSEFFNSLTEEDRLIIQQIIKDSVDTSLFNFLTVLDRVSFIENEKPDYELYRVISDKKELINNHDEEYLHDIFNSLVQDEE